MGSWSSSAPTLPSGSSWSAEVNTPNVDDQFYKADADCSVARGPGNTIYVRFKLNSYLLIPGQGARSFGVKCQVAVGGTYDSASSDVACGGNYYGYWEKDVGRRYYTGTASPGTSIKCRVIHGNQESATATLYAPALITYAVTYDGNGADGGSTADQEKVLGVDLTLANNGFTRNGWAFTGWNTAADGSGTSYDAGGTYSADADLTLYAQWIQTDIPVYENVNGAVKRVAKAYMNVSGAIKECDVYMNVNGTIKELV